MTVNHDGDRGLRTGIPEAVLAEPKTEVDLHKAIRIGIAKNNNLLVTRILDNQIKGIESLLKELSVTWEFDSFKRTLIINPDENVNEVGVAILSAGTSDRYLVEEINYCLKYFGYKGYLAHDIGVAGIHRSREALQKLHENKNIKCIIAVAGQDGALFPVIAGQTRLPVIACPSSVGYGYGGGGEAALLSALQACAPGIAVVNIDNGFGAAAMASKILQLLD